MHYFACSGGKSSSKLTKAVLATLQLHTEMKKSYVTFGKYVYIIMQKWMNALRDKIGLMDL